MKYLASLLFLLPFAAQAQSLYNPGFEEGQEGWKIAEKEMISEVTEGAAHEGKLGLRINDESKESGANVSSDRIPVTPGQKVTLGFFGRSTAENIGAVMIMPYGPDSRAVLNANGKPECVISIKKDKGDWDRYDASYTVPEGVDNVAISIRTWTGSLGSADLDGFELKIE